VLDAREAPPRSSRPAATAREVAAGPPARGATAAGVGLAAASLAAALVWVLVAAAFLMLVAGRFSLRFDGAAGVVVAAGFGLTAAAVLVALVPVLRPATVALATLVPAAALLSGIPVVALPLAAIAVGIAAERDRLRGGRPAASAPVLSMAATVVVVAGLTLATTAGAPPAAGAPARHARPAATASPHPLASRTARPRAVPRPAAGAAAALVSAYYAALNARRFRAAWAMLAPAVRSSFGGFAHWRNGYASTVSSTPLRLAVSARRGGAFAVRHVLVARDRAACGTQVRRYAVAWRIARRPAGRWLVSSLTAVALPRGGGCS
jgi:hypothetical protein